MSSRRKRRYPRTRKKPIKHTVHPKHPRYDVNQYPRGSRLVTREGVTKTEHAWAIDDSLKAHPTYETPTDAWRGDHNRSDVVNVDDPALWRRTARKDLEDEKRRLRDVKERKKKFERAIAKKPSGRPSASEEQRLRTYDESIEHYEKEIDKLEKKLGKKRGNSKKSVVTDIRQLSSGTISSLTGYKKYEDIDREREGFARWTENQEKKGRRFKSWQDAWKSFQPDNSTIIYAKNKDEAKKKVEAKGLGEVKNVQFMGNDHLDNPFYRVTFVKIGLFDKSRNLAPTRDNFGDGQTYKKRPHRLSEREVNREGRLMNALGIRNVAVSDDKGGYYLYVHEKEFPLRFRQFPMKKASQKTKDKFMKRTKSRYPEAEDETFKGLMMDDRHVLGLVVDTKEVWNNTELTGHKGRPTEFTNLNKPISARAKSIKISDISRKRIAGKEIEGIRIGNTDVDAPALAQAVSVLGAKDLVFRAEVKDYPVVVQNEKTGETIFLAPLVGIYDTPPKRQLKNIEGVETANA
jgi:hypothetical protein